MSTIATTSFIAAHCNTTECEIHPDETGEMIAYIPNRAQCSATLKLGTQKAVEADSNAREAGLESRW